MLCSECSQREATENKFCITCFNETKICRKCQNRKSIFEFEKNQKSIAGKISRRGECRDCRKRKKPISSKARKEYEKNHSVPQIGKPFHCPVCKNVIIRQFKNEVVLDHNHHTGEIRGWICRMCNNGMGMMDDDINILERAIKWLSRSLDS